MTQPVTDHFGFTRVGQGESISKNGNAALDTDRVTMDDLMWALSQHSHDGTVALADPDAPPTLSTNGSGGGLPPDTTYYYRISYLDHWGLETAASDEATITTGSVIAAPTGPSLVTDTTGGILAPGTYNYGITAITADGGETTISPVSSIKIPAGTTTNRVYLTFPPLPAGAVSFNVYRARPGQSTLYYLTEAVNGDPIYDTGGAEDATVRSPRFNTTNETNIVTVTVPGGELPDGAVAWNIYRSEQPGVYDGFALVHTVVEGATETSTEVRVDWDDVGDPLEQGQPKEISSTVGGGVPIGTPTGGITGSSGGSGDTVINNISNVTVVAQPVRGSVNWGVAMAGTLTAPTVYSETEFINDIIPTCITAYFRTPPTVSQGVTQTLSVDFTDNAATPNTVSLPVVDTSGYAKINFPITGLLYGEAESGTRSNVSTMPIFDDRNASDGQIVSVTGGGTYVEFDFGVLDAGVYSASVSLRVDSASATPTNDIEIDVIDATDNVVLSTLVGTATSGSDFYWMDGSQFTAPGGHDIKVRFNKVLNDSAQYYVDRFRVEAVLYTLKAGSVICKLSIVDPPLPATTPTPVGNKTLQFSKRQIVFRDGATPFLTTTADVVCGDGGLEATMIVRAATPAAWLTVSPSTGNAPATYTFTADPTGLPPGIYSETVQVVDNGATPTYSADTISVVLIIPSTDFGANANITLWY